MKSQDMISKLTADAAERMALLLVGMEKAQQITTPVFMPGHEASPPQPEALQRKQSDPIVFGSPYVVLKTHTDPGFHGMTVYPNWYTPWSELKDGKMVSRLAVSVFTLEEVPRWAVILPENLDLPF